MLARYLGNKSSILTPILDVIAEVTPPGGCVGDLFAGTMTVSLALKQAGYRVVSNDVNHFSCTVGHAFVRANAIPQVDATLVPRRHREAAAAVAAGRLEALRGLEGYRFLNQALHKKSYSNLLMVLAYLEQALDDDLPVEVRRTDFFDTYTDGGANASFISQRGASGRRRFFTAENGRRIDFVLSNLRYWYKAGMLERDALALMSSLLCRAAEQVGNTQGTWHDFPREWVDSRALQSLRFDPPAMDATLVGGDHFVGDAEDSLELAAHCPEMDTLYLDPPYNFRQYTSYYFLPNAITMYPYIEDLDDFFRKIKFVRGQNMETDHNSRFCKKGEFIDALGVLVARAKTRFVVLSYFNGRNHWNDFKGQNDVGRENLEAFFRGSMFVADSLRVRPVPRKNYQSYKGYKGLDVNEYLFVAEKAI